MTKMKFRIALAVAIIVAFLVFLRDQEASVQAQGSWIEMTELGHSLHIYKNRASGACLALTFAAVGAMVTPLSKEFCE